MTEARTAQMSVRLLPRHRDVYAAAAERFGMDPSTITRQIIELICQRLTDGEDIIDVMYRLKNALGDPSQVVAANDDHEESSGRSGGTQLNAAVEDRLSRLETELEKRGLLKRRL